MPNCFTLTPNGETVPERFATIDDKMCQHFGAEPDSHTFYCGWYDCEGFALALGKDWQWMKNEWPERAHIIEWLAANYTPDSWCER